MQPCLTVTVHLFVVLLIFAAYDVLPPVLIVEVPLDGLADPVLKLCLRQPAELVVDLRRVDSVTLVVSLSVRNVCDEALRLAQLLQDDLYDLDVCLLVVAADVVDFADFSVQPCSGPQHRASL